MWISRHMARSSSCNKPLKKAHKLFPQKQTTFFQNVFRVIKKTNQMTGILELHPWTGIFLTHHISMVYSQLNYFVYMCSVQNSYHK
ncbi:hypothetical protein XELAEV_18029641mg [Xenopus laevis]|uniref:Uncharacterized protein n=1 Tax=Xenopus laevis TaxID=8355 RepID=A0A974CTP3_XENLA|nr:hypothetical protein XELAEV_18029641mg [Xenopus laevis]